MSLFKENVLRYIIRVPAGKVVSYGQVASACGSPRAARQVGGILRSSESEKAAIPWWRVINSQGVISIKGNWTATKELQRALLLKEGIEVSDDYTIDMEKYQFKSLSNKTILE